MKAVNLIPGDSRPGWRGSSARSGASVYLLLGALAVAVALVTVYTLTTNRISDQKAKVAELRTEASQAESMAARLDPYVEFAKLAQARAETVREISSSRFDWHAALAGLSRVVPANTSLESLVGSVVPGASVSGAGASGTGTDLRGDIAAPAFQLFPGRRRAAGLAAEGDRWCDASLAGGFAEERRQPIWSIGQLTVGRSGMSCRLADV